LSKIGRPRSTKGLAVFCARLADSKLAGDILILGLNDIDNSPADYFVICSSDSESQSDAIVDLIISKSKELGLQPPRVEGRDSKEWYLLDFFDVVVHVMLKKVRNYYKLERLWGDSAFYSISEDGKALAYDRQNLNLILNDAETVV
jgi:ribosome-associated protein